mmetsp:Transcript_13845/g.39316  ORF Transcript_13845/g.39316 Transcript_13845/m.39316 type:complete len:219 (-) Transcript_13845:60-716(-)
MAAKTESGRASSSSGAANSAMWPWSSTKTRVESITVSRRCAIVRTVRSLKVRRTSCCSRRSVSLSSMADASSSMSKRLLRRMARTKQISWRWPSDTLSPPSTSSMSSWPTNWPSCTASSASLSSSSLHWLNGSRLNRRVSWNTTGLCGMMARRLRSSTRGILQMSTPSMMIEPERGSTMRRSASRSELLPEPVRPTMPIFSAVRIVREIPWITSGPSR